MLRSKPSGFAPAVLRGFSVASSGIKSQNSFRVEGATKSQIVSRNCFTEKAPSGVTRSRSVRDANFFPLFLPCRSVQNLDFFPLFYPAVYSQIGKIHPAVQSQFETF